MQMSKVINMSSDDLFEEENEDSNSDDIVYGHIDSVNDMDEDIVVPYCIKNMFGLRRNSIEQIFESEMEREKWSSDFAFLLTCVGFTVGLGNVWRFPGKVYQGGGGSFLIPYFFFCIVFGCPMIMLEMILGQFSSSGCSGSYTFCPILSGIGYTTLVMVFISSMSYSVVIGWCLLYLVSSFNVVLPWSICTNDFNTPWCFNVTEVNRSKYNSSYQSSTLQFWNRYVLADEHPDGTFVKITDYAGSPNVPTVLCLLVVMCLASSTIMFGVRVSGKIIYVTVIFPYIVIVQFIVLGCTLPGALKGIKYYLYPRVSKLLDVQTYVMAIEQILYSIGIGAGGLITLSSFRGFENKIQRNVFIIMTIDFATSLIAGFATFPVLGYMSYRSGKKIEDLIVADSSLFFLTFPEALLSLTNSNIWSILFMFMAFTLGIDSLFVMLEVMVTAVTDKVPTLRKKNSKIVLTMLVCASVFLSSLIYTTPGGTNWMDLVEEYCYNFVVPVIILLEIIMIFGIYGRHQFQHDIWLMNGETIGVYWIVSLVFFVPICALIIWVEVIKGIKIIVRHGEAFPRWTFILNWSLNILFICPIFVKAIFVVIRNKFRHPNIGIIQIFKLSFRPPPFWGPRSKRFWIRSVFYSKKLLRYKDNKLFLNSLRKEEHISKLVKLAQLKIDDEMKAMKMENEDEEKDDDND